MSTVSLGLVPISGNPLQVQADIAFKGAGRVGGQLSTWTVKLVLDRASEGDDR